VSLPLNLSPNIYFNLFLWHLQDELHKLLPTLIGAGLLQETLSYASHATSDMAPNPTAYLQIDVGSG
jgi:hypothetical protein